MSSELFIPIKFRTNIIIKPNELDANFEKTILKKVKNMYENVCSKHGYIKNNSIKILERSIGTINNQHFNANIRYQLKCIAEICNPIQGSIIKCKVKAKNSLGLLAEGYYDKIPILEIIVPKISAGIQSEINIDTVTIGQEIKIEVCGKKYQLFDKHISIIGKAIKDKEEFIKTDIIDDDEDIILDDDETIIDVDIEADSIVNPDDEEEEDDEDSKKKEDDEEEEEDDDFTDVELDDEDDNGSDGGFIDDKYDD